MLAAIYGPWRFKNHDGGKKTCQNSENYLSGCWIVVLVAATAEPLWNVPAFLKYTRRNFIQSKTWNIDQNKRSHNLKQKPDTVVLWVE